MKDIRSFFNKRIPHAGLVSASIIFVIMMTYLSINNVTQMIYDCEYYWTIGDPVFESGIHLLNFPETFRGYVWPLAVQIIKRTGGLVALRLVMSICVAVFFSVILPFIYDKAVTRVADMARLILLTVVTLFLWGDFFSYPLSDFVAVFFITAGIACIKYHLNSSGVRKAILLGCVSGLMLYAAYNTRASYLYSIIFLLIYTLIEYRKGRKVRPSFVAGLLIGVILIALPQSLINHQYTGSYSPRVFTEQFTNYQGSLEKRQVLWGLMYSNYESYAGSPEEYPDASVYFKDDTGCEIIEREQITEENFTYGRFIRLFFKYPFDMISIYTRHFVSLMTPKFSQMYLSNIHSEKGIRLILTLVIWFVTLINLVHSTNSKVNWSIGIPVIIIFIPSFLQLLGAPEIRFFIAIHLIGYFYSIYYVDYSLYREMFGKIFVPLMICFLLFSFLWISVLSSVLDNNEKKVLLIDDRKTGQATFQDSSSDNP